MGETKKVLTELKNGVLIVTINREERRNRPGNIRNDGTDLKRC